MAKPTHSPTQKVGIIGHPIGHTASPAMHNAAFRHLGMDWSYAAWDVPTARLRKTLNQLALEKTIGVNVTIPHKAKTAKILKRLDPTARKIGAVNTVVFSKPPRGYNTDGYGLIQALKTEFGFQARGKIIAIAGCGGAGQAAAVSLALAGARKIILLNRTASKVRSVARRIRAVSKCAEVSFQLSPCHLLINATSLGLGSSDPLPLSAIALRALKPTYFLDMIYRPAVTKFMKQMKKEGAHTANGLEMLLHQGARSFEIWTGKKAPLPVMRRALKKEIYG